MRIGITGGIIRRFGWEEGPVKMRELGYTALDYGLSDTDAAIYQCPEAEFEAELKRHRVCCENAGVAVHQVHGPWRWPMRDNTPEDRAERFEKMAKAIRGSALLGCNNYVVHNIMPFGGTDTDPIAAVEMNEEYFGRLCDVAKGYGVTVCLENMPFLLQALARPVDTLWFVRRMAHPNLKICLDTGHSMVFNIQPGAAVRLIGKDLLVCLHVHDNDGKRDCHWNPGKGVVNWDDFAQSLKDIGYDGVVSLETEAAPEDGESQEQAELRLAASAKKIAGIE